MWDSKKDKVSASKTALQKSQVPEARLKVWNKEEIPFGGRGPSQGILGQSGHSQSMDCDGMQS